MRTLSGLRGPRICSSTLRRVTPRAWVASSLSGTSTHGTPAVSRETTPRRPMRRADQLAATHGPNRKFAPRSPQRSAAKAHLVQGAAGIPKWGGGSGAPNPRRAALAHRPRVPGWRASPAATLLGHVPVEKSEERHPCRTPPLAPASGSVLGQAPFRRLRALSAGSARSPPSGGR